MSGLRFPSDPIRLAELWDAQGTASARWDFVATAIARGNLAALRAAGANPSPVGEFSRKSYLTVCDIVAKHDATDILDGIVQMGPAHLDALRELDPGTPYRHLAVEAVRAQALGMWKWLLAQGFDAGACDNKKGTSIAYMIATHGWVEGMQAIEQPVEKMMAWRDGFQRTLLHGAARYAQPAMVRHLLSMGSDPMARDKNHRTPLFLCVAGNTEGMGPERGALWRETAIVLAEHGCSLDEHCGKTHRSQVLRAYLHDRCMDIVSQLPAIDAVAVERDLQAATTHGNRAMGARRL